MEYRTEYKAALEGTAFDNPMDVNSLVEEYTYRDLLDLKDDMVGDVMEYQARTNKQFEKVNSINATSLPSSSPPSKQSSKKKGNNHFSQLKIRRRNLQVFQKLLP